PHCHRYSKSHRHRQQPTKAGQSPPPVCHTGGFCVLRRNRTGRRMTLSTETHAPHPSLTRACTVVLILFATAVLAYTDRQVLSLLVDPIRHDLHISDMQMSLLLGTAFAAIYGVAGVPLGFLADRTSRRN